MAKVFAQLKSYMPISDMEEPAKYVTQSCDHEEITNGVRNITINDNPTHGTLEKAHAGHVGSCEGDTEPNFDFTADIDLGLGEADHEGDAAFLAQGDMYIQAYNDPLNKSDPVDGDGDSAMEEVDCIYLCPILNNNSSIDDTYIADFEPVYSYKTNYRSNMQPYVDSTKFSDGSTLAYEPFKLEECGESEEEAGEESEEDKEEEESAEFMHLGI